MQNVIVPAAIDLFSPENLGGYLATAIVAILGFLITWFLLKLLLYKPIMKVADARAEMVKAGMEANAEEEARLAKLEEEFEQRKAAYLAEEAEHKKQVAEQIELDREAMMKDADTRAKNIISKAEKDAARMQRENEKAYHDDVAELSVKILAAVLQNKAAAEDQEDEIKKMVDMMLAKKE